MPKRDEQTRRLHQLGCMRTGWERGPKRVSPTFFGSFFLFPGEYSHQPLQGSLRLRQGRLPDFRIGECRRKTGRRHDLRDRRPCGPQPLQGVKDIPLT